MIKSGIVDKEFLNETILSLIAFHDKIIENSGGMKGVRDQGGLYNSIYKIFSYQERHKNDPASVAAFVYEDLARRYHFNDGNKRTAHAFAKVVLYLMGFHLKVQYKDAAPFIIEIAKYNSHVTFNNIKDWIKSHLSELPQDDLEKYLNKTVLDIGYGHKNQ